MSTATGRPRPFLSGVFRAACNYCVRSKRGCSGGTPCEHCEKRGKTCVYAQRRMSGPRGRPSGRSQRVRSRAKALRQTHAEEQRSQEEQPDDGAGGVGAGMVQARSLLLTSPAALSPPPALVAQKKSESFSSSTSSSSNNGAYVPSEGRWESDLEKARLARRLSSETPIKSDTVVDAVGGGVQTPLPSSISEYSDGIVQFGQQHEHEQQQQEGQHPLWRQEASQVSICSSLSSVPTDSLQDGGNDDPQQEKQQQQQQQWQQATEPTPTAVHDQAGAGGAAGTQHDSLAFPSQPEPHPRRHASPSPHPTQPPTQHQSPPPSVIPPAAKRAWSSPDALQTASSIPCSSTGVASRRIPSSSPSSYGVSGHGLLLSSSVATSISAFKRFRVMPAAGASTPALPVQAAVPRLVLDDEHLSYTESLRKSNDLKKSNRQAFLGRGMGGMVDLCRDWEKQQQQVPLGSLLLNIDGDSDLPPPVVITNSSGNTSSSGSDGSSSSGSRSDSNGRGEEDRETEFGDGLEGYDGMLKTFLSALPAHGQQQQQQQQQPFTAAVPPIPYPIARCVSDPTAPAVSSGLSSSIPPFPPQRVVSVVSAGSAESTTEFVHRSVSDETIPARRLWRDISSKLVISGSDVAGSVFAESEGVPDFSVVSDADTCAAVPVSLVGGGGPSMSGPEILDELAYLDCATMANIRTPLTREESLMQAMEAVGAEVGTDGTATDGSGGVFGSPFAGMW